MDQLPLELHLKIFGHLDLGDLMALRLVCKKFESIVKEVKIRELVFKKEKDFYKLKFVQISMKNAPASHSWRMTAGSAN